MKTKVKIVLGLFLSLGIVAILTTSIFEPSKEASRPATKEEIERFISGMDFVIKENKDKWWNQR